MQSCSEADPTALTYGFEAGLPRGNFTIETLSPGGSFLHGSFGRVEQLDALGKRGAALFQLRGQAPLDFGSPFDGFALRGDETGDFRLVSGGGLGEPRVILFGVGLQLENSFAALKKEGILFERPTIARFELILQPPELGEQVLELAVTIA